MNHIQLARLHPIMREALREFVRACQKAPFQLTFEQVQAMNRGSDLLRSLDALDKREQRKAI